MSSVSPITEFLNAAERAKAHQVDTVPATLATADAEGRPSARIVLVRSIDERGFGFFTNYESRKGRELIANPFAALCFHWIALDEQIRVEGRAAPMETEESDAYFNGRPRGSQLGAWASTQSRVLRAREDLEMKYREIEAQYEGKSVARPPFWGGFRIVPHRIEFWYGRPDRLHDRIRYEKEGDTWRIDRLYP
jgi:pyridoxamine 5'-phosphate oxidase